MRCRRTCCGARWLRRTPQTGIARRAGARRVERGRCGPGRFLAPGPAWGGRADRVVDALWRPGAQRPARPGAARQPGPGAKCCTSARRAGRRGWCACAAVAATGPGRQQPARAGDARQQPRQQPVAGPERQLGSGPVGARGRQRRCRPGQCPGQQRRSGSGPLVAAGAGGAKLFRAARCRSAGAIAGLHARRLRRKPHAHPQPCAGRGGAAVGR